MEKKKSRRKTGRLYGEKLYQAIREAKKDPEFMKEIRKFIKITTS